MGNTSSTLTAIAGILTSNSLGTYSADSVITPGVLPTIFMKIVPATPDRVIILNMFTQGDEEAGGFTNIGVQVRTRGAQNDPFDADDIADSVYPVLNSVHDLVIAPGIVLHSLMRRTSVQNGQDDNRRYERFDQYYGVLSNTVSTYYS